MKKIILFSLICFASNLVFAQGEWEHTNYVYEAAAPSYADYTIDAVVLNNSNSAVDIHWERREVQLPQGWYTLVCDCNLCYGPATNINPMDKPVSLPENSSCIFTMHANSANQCGIAIVELDLLDGPGGNLLSTAEFVWEICASSTGGPEVENVDMYPNPSIEFFMLTNNSIVDKIELFNIVGSKVKTYEATNGNRYDISDLKQGFYFVSLLNEDEKVMKTMRLTKK